MLGFVKKFVQNSFEHPNVLLGLILLLLPVIFTFLLRVFLRIAQQPLELGLLFVKEVFLWVFSAALLYGLARLFKGKEVKGKFLGILNAISMRYVFSFLTMALVFLAVFSVLPNQFFSKIPQIQSSSSSDTLLPAMQESIQALSIQNPGTLSAGIAIILLLLVFFLFLNLYLAYAIISQSSKEKPGRNFLVLALFILGNYAVFIFI